MGAHDETLGKIRAKTRSENAVFSRLADGTGVLMDLDERRVYEMNSSAATLLESVRDGAGSIADLQRVLVVRYALDEDMAAKGADTFLALMKKALEDDAPRG